MRKRSVMVTVVVILATASAAWPAQLDPARCTPSGSLMRLTGLSEASGLVASNAVPGQLWSHNDSGKPEIFAIDTKGNVTGRVSISGASVEDWEAMAIAPCGNRPCLYLADIGDNDAKRKSITIYRVPEPVKGANTVKVDAVFRASYPDGAHDAETLLASPDGTLYIVTKGDTGQVALYRLPPDSGGGAAVRLERIGEPLSKQPGVGERITDGAISPDGDWVVLRTRGMLMFYRASDFLKGNFREAKRLDLRSAGESQGEGVAFGPANSLYIAGEGGGKSQPGTLAMLTCGR